MITFATITAQAAALAARPAPAGTHPVEWLAHQCIALRLMTASAAEAHCDEGLRSIHPDWPFCSRVLPVQSGPRRPDDGLVPA